MEDDENQREMEDIENQRVVERILIEKKKPAYGSGKLYFVKWEGYSRLAVRGARIFMLLFIPFLFVITSSRSVLLSL